MLNANDFGSCGAPYAFKSQQTGASSLQARPQGLHPFSFVFQASSGFNENFNQQGLFQNHQRQSMSMLSPFSALQAPAPAVMGSNPFSSRLSSFPQLQSQNMPAHSHISQITGGISNAASWMSATESLDRSHKQQMVALSEGQRQLQALAASGCTIQQNSMTPFILKPSPVVPQTLQNVFVPLALRPSFVNVDKLKIGAAAPSSETGNDVSNASKTSETFSSKMSISSILC